MMQMGQISNWGNQLIHPEAIWRITKGRNINVCIIDTGCDDTHPDLKDNVTVKFDPYGGNGDDHNFHGTHVASICGAIDNNFGVVGVAPECSLMIAKGLDDNGRGDWAKIAQCIQWATQNGAHIINMSLGSNNKPSQILHDAIKWATSKGVIVVAAAGNDPTARPDRFSNISTAYPAKYPEVIAVAATDPQGNLAYFSQGDEDVHTAAPGIDIYGCYRNHGYAKLTGTSQAVSYTHLTLPTIYSV